MRLKAGIFGMVLIVAAAASLLAVRPAWRHYREVRSLDRAKGFFARGDWANASLCARQALALNSGNLDACLIMARLDELAHVPQALDWRRRAVELSPTVENRLALAVAGLRAEGPPFPLAAETLGGLAHDADNLPAYHMLSAELALKLKQLARAEAHFLDAARLDPTNGLYQLNLAVLRLRSTNHLQAAAARTALEHLRVSTNLGVLALRWLVSDRLEQQDLAAAQIYSGELAAQPGATIDDRLTHLDILHRANSAQFRDYLAAVQAMAGTNAGQANAVCEWMLGNELVQQAAAWLTGRPPNFQAQPPVRLALAECYAGLRDWGGLKSFLEREPWEEIEFLRLAWLSRAAAQQQERFAAEAQWRLAVRQANDRIGPLLSLLKLATSWGRTEAREDLLWLIAQRHSGERWALKELDRLYAAQRNTRGLNKVHAVLVTRDSSDAAAKNNLAATSMLLNINLPRAHELATEVYFQHPADPVIASTYAYSLHLQGRTREGLAILEKLPRENLDAPGVAVYYGALLRADGRAAEAEPYLALARGAQLLPEEEALAGRAQSGP